MKYLYEFIGTFFLVFTVAMTVSIPFASGILAPLAIGSILAVMIYAGAHISGGHYNPAVSLAVYLRGILSLKDLGLYWVSQLCGAIAAALFTIYFKDQTIQSTMDFDIFKALLAEFFFTFALCFVVLNVGTAKETAGNTFFGFAIGFTVLAGAYAVGPISGGAFNPAVALGVTIMGLSFWSNIWVFFVANLLGGVAAAWIFNEAHNGIYVKKD